MSAELPRVTAILRACGLGPDFVGVPPAVLEAAAARGTAVHAAIEAHAYGYYEPSDLPAEAAPYLAAYETFLKDSGHEPIASEVEVIHPDWQYVGHVDRIGWLVRKRALLDWKTAETVDLRAAAYQLAGYRAAWNATHPTEPVDLTGVVQLKRDGTYRFHDVNAKLVESVFFASVVVWRAQQEKRT